MKIRLLPIGVIILFLTGFFMTSSSTAIELENFVGMWKFDEGAGIRQKIRQKTEMMGSS